MSQMLPWGVPSTQVVSTQSEHHADRIEAPDQLDLPPNSLTTEKFDEIFANKVSTLTTDETFSWIVSRTIDNYDMSGYFIREIITQLFVSVLLVIFLLLTIKLPLNTRLILVSIAGVLAAGGIYGQFMNWWGLPILYGLGASFNLVFGWVLTSVVLAKFFIKSEE